MAGNLSSSQKVWEFLLEFIENLSTEFDLSEFDTIVNVCPHNTYASLKELKNLGIKQVQYNLEIANKDIFTYTCPGKLPYDKLVEIYLKYNQRPIFCSLSSRSSIVNEVYYDNIK